MQEFSLELEQSIALFMLIRDLDRNTACMKTDQYVIQIQYVRDVEACSHTHPTYGTLPRKLQKYIPSDGF